MAVLPQEEEDLHRVLLGVAAAGRELHTAWITLHLSEEDALAAVRSGAEDLEAAIDAYNAFVRRRERTG